MKHIFTAFALLFGITVSAQQTDIPFSPASDGTTFDTCGGFIIDSGGQGGTGYGVGENSTITICPDTVTAGDNSLYITVIYNLFQLDGTNTGTQQNPNVDQMSVFDGPSTASPTLGTYNTDELEGVSISATNLNGSGCLTFVFYSNATGTGSFSGSATCTQPCVPPVADAFIVAGDTPDSIRVCIGEEVTLDGSASTGSDGFNIAEYEWNFMDGNVDNTTGPVVTHSWNAPGQYQVQLVLTDDNPDNPCSNLNVVPLKVYVSNYPTFHDFPPDTTICLGEEVNLIGISDFGLYDSTWTGFPGTNVIDDGCLTDDLLGVAQNIPVTYTEFDPSATVTSVDDIVDICLSMEHSFMGDLIIQLSCPNGTTINLLTQDGAGGTQIGVPDQADNVDCENQTGIGEGWTYCWTNNAPQTWNEWVDAQGGFGLTLPEGDYASEEPLSDLIGCPLTGTWQITVIDNWAADDGTIFEFGVTFDPSFYPDIVEFTNTVGESADSSFWDLSDPDITSNTSDLNEINILPSSVGTYPYNYFCVNDFGCEFDSTVTVTVIDGPEITAGPDMVFCVDPVQLEGAVVGGPVPTCGTDAGNYSYCWDNGDQLIVTYCPDVPSDGVTMMTLDFLGGTMDQWADWVTIYDGDNQFAPWLDSPNVTDMAGFSYTANNPTGCITFVLNTDNVNSCADGTYSELEVMVGCTTTDDGMTWSWDPPTGLTDANIANPFATITQATTYTLSGYPNGFPACAVTDQMVVAPDALADPGLDTDTIVCYNSPISFLVDYLEGNPAFGGVWTDAGGNVVPDVINPSDYLLGQNFVYTYTVGSGNCVGFSTLNLTVLAATNLNCCQTNAVAGTDAAPCEMSYQLQAESPAGIGTWTGPASIHISDVNDPNAIATSTTPGGEIATLTWTDNNGLACSDFDEITITFSDPVSLIVITEDALCYNQNSGTAIAVTSGGTSPDGNYFYDWELNGKPGIIPQTRDSLLFGTYQVKVEDMAGCTDSAMYVIGQPDPQEIFVTQAPPLCAEECSGVIGIRSAGAIEYSFNGGVTFGSDSTSYSCDGAYLVIAKNANGCEISQMVNLIDPPEFEARFNINPNPTTIKNTRITFQDVSYPGPIGKSLFQYGDDPILGEGDSRISAFTFPKDTAGIYPVTLMTTSVNGCTDTLTQEVIIHDDLLWYIPNSFTPNSDGINDIWRPVGNTLDINDYQLTIVDRWGKEVFSTKDFEAGWNGTSGGDGDYYLPTGVYTYLLKVSSATSEEKREITGFITLVR